MTRHRIYNELLKRADNAGRSILDSMVKYGLWKWYVKTMEEYGFEMDWFAPYRVVGVINRTFNHYYRDELRVYKEKLKKREKFEAENRS